MRVSLIIFDCDGVLIDSEPIANRIFSEQLAKVGMHMTPGEVWHAFVGNSRDRCIAMAGEMRGEPLPEGFAEMWDDALHAALDIEAPRMLGEVVLGDVHRLPRLERAYVLDEQVGFQ